MGIKERENARTRGVVGGMLTGNEGADSASKAFVPVQTNTVRPAPIPKKSLNVYVPADLTEDVKRILKFQNRTMSEVFTEFLRGYVEQNDYILQAVKEMEHKLM